MLICKTSKTRVCSYSVYTQFGTEEDEKKENEKNVTRVWVTEYDIVQPAQIRPKQVL